MGHPLGSAIELQLYDLQLHVIQLYVYRLMGRHAVYWYVWAGLGRDRYPSVTVNA